MCVKTPLSTRIILIVGAQGRIFSMCYPNSLESDSETAVSLHLSQVYYPYPVSLRMKKLRRTASEKWEIMSVGCFWSIAHLLLLISRCYACGAYRSNCQSSYSLQSCACLDWSRQSTVSPFRNSSCQVRFRTFPFLTVHSRHRTSRVKQMSKRLGTACVMASDLSCCLTLPLTYMRLSYALTGL